MRRREPVLSSLGLVCGPSSPFRRLTTAHEELASYIHGCGAEAAVDGAFPRARLRAHVRLNDIEERVGDDRQRTP